MIGDKWESRGSGEGNTGGCLKGSSEELTNFDLLLCDTLSLKVKE